MISVGLSTMAAVVPESDSISAGKITRKTDQIHIKNVMDRNDAISDKDSNVKFMML